MCTFSLLVRTLYGKCWYSKIYGYIKDKLHTQSCIVNKFCGWMYLSSFAIKWNWYFILQNFILHSIFFYLNCLSLQELHKYLALGRVNISYIFWHSLSEKLQCIYTFITMLFVLSTTHALLVCLHHCTAAYTVLLRACAIHDCTYICTWSRVVLLCAKVRKLALMEHHISSRLLAYCFCLRIPFFPATFPRMTPFFVFSLNVLYSMFGTQGLVIVLT